MKRLVFLILVTALLAVSLSGCDLLESLFKSEPFDFYLNEEGTGYWLGRIRDEEMTEIVIPDTYKGLPVVGISGLQGWSDIVSVTLPETITDIDDYTFDGCTSLTSINIPDSVTHIGAFAFQGCENLVKKQDGIHYVGKWIVGCDEQLDTYTPTLRGDTIGIADRGLWPNMICHSVQLPASLRYIGSDAIHFDWSDGTAEPAPVLVLPEGLTRIGTRFIACQYPAISIPASLTDIAPGAFLDCWSLTEVTIAEDNPAYMIEDGILYTKDKTVLHSCINRQSLEHVTVPDGVTRIEEAAFYRSEGLRSVILPEGLLIISAHSFSECLALESINLPSTVTVIDQYAFSACQSLKRITIPAGVTELAGSVFGNCTALKEVIFAPRSQFIKIYSFTFENCESLESFTVPASSSIGAGNFSGCINLKEFIVEEGSDFHFAKDGVLYARLSDGNVLVDYPSAKEDTAFTVPEDVIAIESWAFDHCRYLQSLTMPAGITYLSSSTVDTCESLQGVIFPAGCKLTVIHDYNFRNCTALKEINVPASVTQIDESVFQGCTALQTLTFESDKSWSFDGQEYTVAQLQSPEGITLFVNPPSHSRWTQIP